MNANVLTSASVSDAASSNTSDAMEDDGVLGGTEGDGKDGTDGPADNKSNGGGRKRKRNTTGTNAKNVTLRAAEILRQQPSLACVASGAANVNAFLFPRAEEVETAAEEEQQAQKLLSSPQSHAR